MPKYSKDGHTVETSNKREAVRLKAAGYREDKPRAKSAEADKPKSDTPQSK